VATPPQERDRVTRVEMAAQTGYPRFTSTAMRYEINIVNVNHQRTSWIN
jgi:hypothetical protein